MNDAIDTFNASKKKKKQSSDVPPSLSESGMFIFRDERVFSQGEAQCLERLLGLNIYSEIKWYS